MICEYGCGQESHYTLKNGRRCCSKNHKSCPYSRFKNSKIRKGIPHTEETKKKISESNKGKSPWNKGKCGLQIAWNKGKTNIYSKEILLKMSENSKGKKGYWTGKKRDKRTIEKIKQNHADISMEKNPNWRGGISCEPYCWDWTKEYKNYIKERDGHKCLNPACWGSRKRLVVHHINYNKKSCVPENLITLCDSCNSRANKDRKWHEAWYNSILFRRYGIITNKN